MRIDHAILRKIQFIEDSKDEIDYEGFRIVEYPERNIFLLERKQRFMQENPSIFIQRLFL